jgi:hypothetical protein
MTSRHVADSFDALPVCCQNCRQMDWDGYEDYGPWWYFCLKNVMLPVKKQACKWQEYYQNSQSLFLEGPNEQTQS